MGGFARKRDVDELEQRREAEKQVFGAGVTARCLGLGLRIVLGLGLGV